MLDLQALHGLEDGDAGAGRGRRRGAGRGEETPQGYQGQELVAAGGDQEQEH